MLQKTDSTILVDYRLPDAIPLSVFQALCVVADKVNANNRGELDSEFVVPTSALPPLEVVDMDNEPEDDDGTEALLAARDEDEDDRLPNTLFMQDTPCGPGEMLTTNVGGSVTFNGVEYVVFRADLDGRVEYRRASSL